MTDTEWVLVPKVATPAMLNAANEVMPRITLITSGYAAMLSASPDPSQDEGLVERIARAIEPNAFAGRGGFDLPSKPLWRDKAISQAVAVLNELKVKP